MGCSCRGARGPAGPAGPAGSGASDQRGTGMYVIDRVNATGNATIASGVLRLTYFTAVRSERLGALAATTSSPAAVGVTDARYALYTVAGDPYTTDGDLTLLAATPTDTTLFAATHTRYVKDTSALYDVVEGQRYAWGVWGVWTTAPNLWGAAGSFATLAESPRQTGQVAGLAALPDTIAAATLTGSNASVLGEILST
jgi:hypothetical protein